jgi:hypothetical protein
MKIAITGHTSGLGQAFFNYFSKSHEVIGLSRTNGFDIETDTQKIVDIVSSVDLFFNNAHSGVQQAILIKKLHNCLPIITSGSIGADWAHLDNYYFKEKLFIENVHKDMSKTRLFPTLLLKMGFLENSKFSKYQIPYQNVINSVEFWIKNPVVTLIEFDNHNI